MQPGYPERTVAGVASKRPYPHSRCQNRSTAKSSVVGGLVKLIPPRSLPPLATMAFRSGKKSGYDMAKTKSSTLRGYVPDILLKTSRTPQNGR